MAVTYVAAGTVSATAPGIPAGVVSGDFLLLVSAKYGGDPSHSTPSGWTALKSGNSGGGSGYTQNGFKAYYKIASGSDSSPSLSDTTNGQIFAFTGVDGVSPLNATSSSVSTSAAASSISIPSVTTTVADCMVVGVVTTAEAGSVGTISPGSSWNNSTTSTVGSVTGSVGVRIRGGNQSSAAASDTGSTTGMGTGTYCAFSFALKPSAGGGGGGATTPTLRSISSSLTSGTSSQSVSLPTHQADDLLLMFVDDAGGSLNTPSGWTNLFTGTGAGNPSSGAQATRVTVFYKLATSSSETSPTISFSSRPYYARYNVTVASFYNVNTSSPFDGTASGAGSANASALTTTDDNSLVVLIGAIGGNYTASPPGTFWSWSNGNLTTLTDVSQLRSWSASYNGGDFAASNGLAVFTAKRSGGAGSTGTSTGSPSWAGGVSYNSSCGILALKPPAAAATGAVFMFQWH